MTWYADGTPYEYTKPRAVRRAELQARGGPAPLLARWLEKLQGDDPPGLVNAGWLDGAHAFPRGPVPGAVLDRLAWLCIHEPQEQKRGLHACELCPYDDHAWYHVVRDGERPHVLGSAEVRVRGESTSYAAPDLVLHYIVDHGYLPPPDFLAQVAALPHALPAGWSVRRLTHDDDDDGDD